MENDSQRDRRRKNEAGKGGKDNLRAPHRVDPTVGTTGESFSGLFGKSCGMHVRNVCLKGKKGISIPHSCSSMKIAP